jgi:hypothetical protein
MDRIGAGLSAGCDDLVDNQVALRGWRRPDMDRGIRQLDVRGKPIDVAIDRDGRDSAFPTRTHDADSDFATIGDENAADRGGHRGALYYCEATRCIARPADLELKRIGELRWRLSANAPRENVLG